MAYEMNQDVTICAVVPVAKMSGQLSNLESWLQSAIQNEIRVYLIHDIQDSLTGPELKTIVSLKNSPLVTLHEGRFGGPGLARNFGLELATEDWIFFWDADDLPDPKASKFMITRHMQDLTVDASILAGGFEIREKKSKKTLGYSPFSFNQQQNMQNLACHIGLWRCAFRRIDIAHKFNFTRMGEDQYFLFQNLSSRKILFFADRIYIYFVGVDGQLTSNKAVIPELFENFRLIEKQVRIREEKDFQELMLFKQLITLLKKGGVRGRLFAFVKICLAAFLNPRKTTKIIKTILVRKYLSNPTTESKPMRFMLTGGLGNQLFKIAAALSESSYDGILGVTSFSEPRMNSYGEVECNDFNFPFSFQIQNKQANIFVKKAVSFSLRSGISSGRFESNSIAKKFIKLASSSILTTHFNIRTKAEIATDVGYFSLGKISQDSFLIGYFQSARYLGDNPNVMNSFKKISIKNPSETLRNLIDQAKKDSPIIIHIRLGDYLNEPDFGILGPKYYENAIARLSNILDYSRIWIFSDDIDLAKTKYGDLFGENAKWISGELLSSAETIELMRYGAAYVIANSTFSWWGASLAYKFNPTVIAPHDWFRSKKDPSELIPENWIRISSDFSM